MKKTKIFKSIYTDNISMINIPVEKASRWVEIGIQEELSNENLGKPRMETQHIK